MNITQIKYFLTVTKYLNFTSAANALYITQPALSRQIQMMEEELGCMLFIRTSRSMQMTPSARILKDEFEKIYNSYNVAVAKARSAYQGINGSISIGILDGTRVSDLFPKVLGYFNEHYANVEIKMRNYSFSKLLDNLYSGELDFVITLKFDIEQQKHLDYKIIEKTKDYIVVNKDHRLAGAKKVKLSDFVDDTFIMVSTEDSLESPRLILDGFAKCGVSAPKVKFAPSIQTEMLWVQAGLGVCMLDSRNMLVLDDDVHFCEVDGVSDPSLVLAWRKNNTNPYMQTFIDNFTYYENAEALN